MSSPGAAKIFTCSFGDCGKIYTRAEHLQRHQLNQDAPKEVFRCEVPGCDRTFVRQDLYHRHRERHGSNTDQSVQPSDLHESTEVSTRTKRRRVGRPSLADVDKQSKPVILRGRRKQAISTVAAEKESPAVSHISENTSVRQDPRALSPVGIVGGPGSNADRGGEAQQGVNRVTSMPHWTFPYTPAGLPSTVKSYQDALPPLSRQYSGDHILPQPSRVMDPSPSLSIVTNEQTHIHHGMGYHRSDDAAGLLPTSTPNSMTGLDAMVISGHQNPQDESPLSINDNFAAWLFNSGSNTCSYFGQVDPGTGFAPTSNMGGSDIGAFPYSYDIDGSFPSVEDMEIGVLNKHSPRAVSASASNISFIRRMELIDFMRTNFSKAVGNSAQLDQLDAISGGVHGDDVFGDRVVEAYVQTYWDCFHDQLPILHRSTFSIETDHILLVLVVIMIGASLLPDQPFGHELTEKGQRLARYIAWHLRWHVFMDADFQPPAKLWVFQVLVLLEVYEKMISTRALHERAHIHYGTTINLMRRGTALIDDAPTGPSLPSNLSPHEHWERWVTAEATRRVAFAAFMMDTLHANMFGHTAVMVVHEIHLPLPCDDALWSATSPAELSRIEASFCLNGIKPMTFINALKQTLTGQKVRTNTFCRSIIIAGLLSVSWHLRQREVQMSTLGVPQANAVPDRWRTALSKAFDAWKTDADEDATRVQSSPFTFESQSSGAQLLARSIVEMPDVLHHFSHITLHINPLELQILAGARKLLGRVVTRADRCRVRKTISTWAKSPDADQACWHAVRLLEKYLQPDTPAEGSGHYVARDDCMFLRAWVLYLAALTVWSRAYVSCALPHEHVLPADGVIDAEKSQTATPLPETLENNETRKPVNRTVPDGNLDVHVDREYMSRLLQKLVIAFDDSRWELLREAAERLRQADEMLYEIGYREDS